jgi:hypothetical protein
MTSVDIVLDLLGMTDGMAASSFAGVMPRESAASGVSFDFRTSSNAFEAIEFQAI